MVVGEGQENQRRKRRTRRLGKGRGELRSSERENLLLLRLACCQAPKAPDFHHVTFLEVQELVAGSKAFPEKEDQF